MDTAQTQMQPTQEPQATSILALQIAAMTAKLRDLPRDMGKHRRAGVTKNKMRGESKARRRMAKESRRHNRGQR